MKVLMVCTVPTEKSGIPMVIFNLMEAIRRNETLNNSEDRIELGYSSISAPDEFFKAKLEKLGVNSYYIPRQMNHPLGYIRKLAEVAKGYDVMHVHGNSATMVLEMIAASIAGVKIRLAHSHNTTSGFAKIDRMSRPLFYKLCTGRLACGVEAGKWLFRNQEFMVCNNGIETSRFKFNPMTRGDLRRRLGWEECHVIGHVGNFVVQKNHKFLIDRFASVAEKDSKARLLLLGSGPLEDNIRTLAKQKRIMNKIHFAGSVSNPEDYLDAMDMVVMPSLFEGLPLTMVEEQANGLRILAADSITPDANLSGNVDFLGLDEVSENWDSRIIEILRESSCEDRKDISDKSIKKIQEGGYDINIVADKLVNYYKGLIEKKEAKGSKNR